MAQTTTTENPAIDYVGRTKESRQKTNKHNIDKKRPIHEINKHREEREKEKDKGEGRED